MLEARWVLSALLALAFLGIAVVNWGVLIRGVVKRVRGTWIPLFGGVCGAAGVLVLPLDGAWRFFWLPLVLDWGSIPGLVHAGVLMLRRRAR
jgi:hypothetical protein